MSNPISQGSYSYGTKTSTTDYELDTEPSNAIRDSNVEEPTTVLLRYARDNWSMKFSYVNDSSAIIDTIDVEMQDITQDDFPVEIYIVIDTNVLISHLSALKDLVSILHSNDRSRMSIVLLIPGIVVAELDYQKNYKREIAFESRKASEWLAKEISSGQGIVKGQAYSQTLLPSGDWRQRVGLSNDELILDCSKYFTRIKQKDVRLCTSDNNLVIQAAANANDLFSRDASAAILRPTLTWNCYQMLQQVLPGYVQPSMHALGRDSQKSTKRIYHYDKMIGDNSVPRMDVDVDMDTIIESQSSSHWRDQLHQCIVSELQGHIRRIVEKATRLQEQRRKTESRYSRANSLFTGSLPTEEDWIQGWGIRDCLRYLIKILPPSLNRRDPFEEGDASSLADFLSLPGEKGARPGREWSKNDWGRELTKVSRLAQDYEYEGLDSNTMHNYEYRILTSFM